MNFSFWQAAILLASLLLGNQAIANSFFRLSLGAASENNVPRGLISSDERESEKFQAQFSGGKFYQLGLNDTMTVTGTVAATRYNMTQGFDKIAVSLSADYGHRFGFGAYAPRVGAVLSIGRENFRGKARDNDLTTLEINYQQRLSPGWFFTAGIDYQSSDSESLEHHPMLTEFGYDENNSLPYALFDYESTSLFADIEYAFANEILLSAGYRRIDGHTVASTLMPTHHLYKISEAFYIDPAFDEPWYAYLLESATNEWSAAVSFPLARDSSLNIAYSWQDIEARGNRNYKNEIVSVTFVRSF